mmetsp:Transcript_97690/g.252820  ORF Transcript_97690/g.252820 Transcript_97690/m.252820 type:complete len:244 (+) Transcript_97690:453-1184(+)
MVCSETCVAIAARAACCSFVLLRKPTKASDMSAILGIPGEPSDDGDVPPGICGCVQRCLCASAAVMRSFGLVCKSSRRISAPAPEMSLLVFNNGTESPRTALVGKQPSMMICRMTPMLHRSLTATNDPLTASGARYWSVPTTCELVTARVLVSTAKPKSMILTAGHASRGVGFVAVDSARRRTMMFSGFRSRCSTLCAWQYCRAPKTCFMMPAARHSWKSWCLRMHSSISSKSSRPSMYSRTR